MGGDRDGNSFVTPQVTMEVVVTQRLQAAKLIVNEIVSLYKELAICKGFSHELVLLAGAVEESFDVRELYRRVLGHLRARLMATVRWCEQQLDLRFHSLHLSTLHVDTPSSGVAFISAASTIDAPRNANTNANTFEFTVPAAVDLWDSADEVLNVASAARLMGEATDIFTDAAPLLRILKVMHASLSRSGYKDVADGKLVDLIRRVAAFGLTLAPLDIRQASAHPQCCGFCAAIHCLVFLYAVRCIRLIFVLVAVAVAGVVNFFFNSSGRRRASDT